MSSPSDTFRQVLCAACRVRPPGMDWRGVVLVGLTAIVALASAACGASERREDGGVLRTPSPSPPAGTAGPRRTPEASARSGKGLIAFKGEHFGGSGIFVMDAATGEAARLTTGLEDYSPAWSPDGSRIAFAARRGRLEEGCCHDIYVINADGAREIRLTDTAESEGSPAWSPDGRRIAYSARGSPTGKGSGDYSSDIYVMNADGAGRKRLTDDGKENALPTWLPDSEGIAFTTQVGPDAYEARVVNADGSGGRRLAELPAGASYPVWSPDGRSIAYVRDDDIYVQPAGGGASRRLTEGRESESDPAWSPDGESIAFVSSWESSWDIYVVDLRGGAPERLTSGILTGATSPAWSPAGVSLGAREQVELGDSGILLAPHFGPSRTGWEQAIRIADRYWRDRAKGPKAGGGYWGERWLATQSRSGDAVSGSLRGTPVYLVAFGKNRLPASGRVRRIDADGYVLVHAETGAILRASDAADDRLPTPVPRDSCPPPTGERPPATSGEVYNSMEATLENLGRAAPYIFLGTLDDVRAGGDGPGRGGSECATAETRKPGFDHTIYGQVWPLVETVMVSKVGVSRGVPESDWEMYNGLRTFGYVRPGERAIFFAWPLENAPNDRRSQLMMIEWALPIRDGRVFELPGGRGESYPLEEALRRIQQLAWGESASFGYAHFAQLGGITYVEDTNTHLRGTLLDAIGAKGEDAFQGVPGLEVRAVLGNDNVDPSSRRLRDGDASCRGSSSRDVVEFAYYKRQFRTVLRCDRAILQEAYVSPGARKGSDVLDLGGEATAIEVLAAHDPSRRLGVISGEGEVRALTSLVLAAPVRPSARDWDAHRVIVVFRMEDGLNVVRWYWPESGELTPITTMRTTAVAPAPAFGAAIERTLTGR